MKSARNRSGFTLTEVLISVSLVSILFLAATAVYVSSLQSFKGMDAKAEEITALLAMEHLSRRVGLGNSASVSDAGKQLKVRWDYDDYANPAGPGNGTPSNFADDTFIKYGLIEGRLRFRLDAAEAGDVTANDPEVEPGLLLTQEAIFTQTDVRHIAIAFSAQVGNPARTKSMRSEVALQGRAL